MLKCCALLLPRVAYQRTSRSLPRPPVDRFELFVAFVEGFHDLQNRLPGLAVLQDCRHVRKPGLFSFQCEEVLPGLLHVRAVERYGACCGKEGVQDPNPRQHSSVQKYHLLPTASVRIQYTESITLNHRGNPKDYTNSRMINPYRRK